MSNERSYHSVVRLQSFVVVVGGQDQSRQPLVSAEVLDTETLKWVRSIRAFTDLPFIHWYQVGVSLGPSRCLFGSYGLDSKEPSSVDVYAQGTRPQTMIPLMKTPRENAAAALVGSRLVVVGVYDGNKSLSSVECLDVDVGSQVASLQLTWSSDDVDSATGDVEALHRTVPPRPEKSGLPVAEASGVDIVLKLNRAELARRAGTTEQDVLEELQADGVRENRN